MGRAIVRDPQVFLFDEPLSNLDAKLRVQMRTEIKELHQRLGTTTVYVTHDQIEAMTMADRIVVHARRHGRAGRRAARALRPPGQPVRRGLHRLAGDELPQGHDRGRTAAPSSSPKAARAAAADAPGGSDGRPAVYGIRPEHLSIGDTAALPAEVSVVEPTGSETQVFAMSAGRRWSRCRASVSASCRGSPSTSCPILGPFIYSMRRRGGG